MKVIDLLMQQFNNGLKDKTMFRVLNQKYHDKYIYDIKNNEFYEYKNGKVQKFPDSGFSISLVINDETVNYEIEIIEEERKGELNAPRNI